MSESRGSQERSDENRFTLPPLPKENSFFGAPKWHQVTEYGHQCAEAARAPLLARIAELEALEAAYLCMHAKVLILEEQLKRGNGDA